MKRKMLHLAAALLFAVFTFIAGASLYGQTSKPEQVVKIKLPLELAAIGNLDAAKNWRFGRIEQVVQIGGSEDVTIHIRVSGGKVLKVIGPRVLRELAKESDWYHPQGNSRISRTDYVERMVAFDVDASDRIIAMISLEPLNRDNSRLKRALCD